MMSREIIIHYYTPFPTNHKVFDLNSVLLYREKTGCHIDQMDENYASYFLRTGVTLTQGSC
jgi:hypothetical protein